MDPEVPLVVAEVNPEALDRIPKGIVANPNCTTMVAMPVLKPLDREAGLRRIVVSTYQAVSGAGLAGVDELAGQIEAGGGADKIAALTHDGAAVSLPSGPKFVGDDRLQRDPARGQRWSTTGRSRPTRSRSSATRAARSSTCPTSPCRARACACPSSPGTRSRSTPSSTAAITPERAREVLGAAPGVVLDEVPTPLKAAGIDPSLVGRIRRDEAVEHGLALFVSGDNLRKGAALNAIQIAEVLLARR